MQIVLKTPQTKRPKNIVAKELWLNNY